MDLSLKQDIRLLKVQTFQYLQQLKNNLKAECTIQPFLDSIFSKISERKFQIVKSNSERMEKIKNFKQDIELKKNEYYTKCKRLIDLYNAFDGKIQELETSTKESSECSIS